MKWSIKLGRYYGIDVYIHATFLMLIAALALISFLQGESFQDTLIGVGFVLAIFGCVLLHEFGHALAARRYNIPTRDITLYPIGGVARLERMPENPKEELLVALAGPAVNVVIALLLFVYLYSTSNLVPLETLGMTEGSLLERLMIVNIMLVVFNLLPAFPMDGGRVVRALLANWLDYTDATQIAAALGQGMALVFGFIGFFFIHPFLLFIAFFVWIGAEQEASMVRMKSALGGIPVLRAMITEFHTLSPESPLSEAVELIIRGSQQDFPVVEEGRVVGVLTRSDLMKALANQDTQSTVSTIMKSDFTIVHPYDMLESAFARLQECQCQTIPVVKDNRLVGLITSENIGEFMMIQSALHSKKSAQPSELLG